MKMDRYTETKIEFLRAMGDTESVERIEQEIEGIEKSLEDGVDKATRTQFPTHKNKTGSVRTKRSGTMVHPDTKFVGQAGVESRYPSRVTARGELSARGPFKKSDLLEVADLIKSVTEILKAMTAGSSSSTGSNLMHSVADGAKPVDKAWKETRPPGQRNKIPPMPPREVEAYKQRVRDREARNK